MMLLRRKKSKSLALENGSETCLKDVSAKILKAEFIHTLLLPKRLNAKLETFIESTCESLINQTLMNHLNIETSLDLEQVLDICIIKYFIIMRTVLSVIVTCILFGHV